MFRSNIRLKSPRRFTMGFDNNIHRDSSKRICDCRSYNLLEFAYDFKRLFNLNKFLFDV